MTPSTIEKIIETALSYVPDSGKLIFTCEREPFVISLHTVRNTELTVLDARLHGVAEHLHTLFGGLGQKATNNLRLTMEHWRNPSAARGIGGTDFMSSPRTVQPGQHPDCVLLTADIYNLCTLPNGVTYAFGRQFDYKMLQHKTWMNENYPGAFDKMQYLLTIGEFSPEEMASLVFTDSSPVTVDMSGITPY